MTLAEDIALEHITWLRRSGKTWPAILEQACIARRQAGLSTIPVVTGDDVFAAFAQAWAASQVQRMAAE